MFLQVLIKMDKFKIKKISTAKHKIKQKKIMEKMVIAKHPGISLFNGSQGSGKTNLVANLLLNKAFYGGYFDHIFVLLGSMDDIYEHLVDSKILEMDKISHNPTPEDLGKIIDTQNAVIENEGIEKSPKLLVLIDDLINDQVFMNSKELQTIFIKQRHLNISTWFLTQYLNKVPRALRCQCNFLYVFKPLRVEVGILFDQFAPAEMNRDKFRKLISYCTDPDEESDHNFMVISRKSPTKKMFRKNIIEFVSVHL